ncbi:MAG: rhomboid family intramembrane serine protease [Bacteroidetes bacterium]|nr:rhomboid family intramembrane serine protease [Bacteroidota bacterium]
MFFPIGDTNIEKGYRPVFTYLLLAINIAVYIYQIFLPRDLSVQFVNQYASIPVEIVNFQSLHTLFTSMFLHGGFMHLAGNMMFLWIFGDNVEAIIGTTKYIFFYIGGGLIAALAHVAFNMHSTMPCVGASGAIAACMGAYLVMFPKSKIRVILLLFFIPFNIRAIYFLGLWIVLQFRSEFLNYGASTSTNIAYMAHIGGFVFGLLCGMVFRNDIKDHHLRFHN